MIAKQIQQAIENGYMIEIAYTKFDDTSSIRVLSDIEYSLEYGSTHISAFCHTRQEQRTFKISRISSVRVIDNTVSSSKVPSQTIDVNKPYVFNPNKRIFKLYGE